MIFVDTVVLVCMDKDPVLLNLFYSSLAVERVVLYVHGGILSDKISSGKHILRLLFKNLGDRFLFPVIMLPIISVFSVLVPYRRQYL